MAKVYEASLLPQAEHDILTCLTGEEDAAWLHELQSEFELLAGYSAAQIAMALANLTQKKMILQYPFEGSLRIKLTKYGEDVVMFRSSTEREVP